MSIKKYFENHLKVHTLRIELIEGQILFYNISASVKEDLEKWLSNCANDFMEFHNIFLSFYSTCDRMVFIRISSMKRLIFCWDMITQVTESSSYHDHFSVTYKDEDDLIIPHLIIKLRGSAEPVVYEYLDIHSNFLGIDEESFKNPHFLMGGFLIVRDEDGEKNYIPMTNVEYIEVSRVHIYPDDMWQEMQNISDNRDVLN